nr:probable ribonuclease ZC3H12C [Salvelinus alpinus]
MGTKRGSAPKRQCEPSIWALSYGEAEGKLRHAEKCNSLSSSSGSSCCSGSVTLSPAPGGPPSALSDPQEQPPSLGRDTPYMTLPYPHPDPYSSSCRSTLAWQHGGVRSAASRWTPTCVCWARQTVAIAAVTCTEREPTVCAAQALCWTNTSTISSISTINTTACTLNTLPPCSSHTTTTHTPTSALYGCHQNLARGHSFPHDEPPEAPSVPPPLQHQAVGARSSCPGDYPSVSQSGPYPPGSPLGRCLTNTWLETLSDSRPYERTALPPRIAFSWDPYCSQPPQSRCETYQSTKDPRCRLGTHISMRTDHTLLPPPSPTLLLSDPSPIPCPSAILPVHAPPPHAPGAPRPEPVRGKVYLILCNIFPSELVGRVMGRNPDVTDAQQLAAAILAEKSQSGY